MEFRQIWSHWPPLLSGASEYSTSYTQNSCQSFIWLNQKSCLAKKLFLDWRTIWCRFTSACCFIFGQMMEGGMAVDGQTGRQKCVTRKYRTNWYLNGLRIKQWIQLKCLFHVLFLLLRTINLISSNTLWCKIRRGTLFQDLTSYATYA